MTHPLITRLLSTNAGGAALALRIPVGIIFAAHGAQKLFGWFGSYGLEGTGQWMASIGLALIIGLLVRPAAAVLAIAMLVAIFSVHIGNGLFMSNKGYEFGLALLAVSVSLLVSGAGRASIDAALSQGASSQAAGAKTLSPS